MNEQKDVLAPPGAARLKDTQPDHDKRPWQARVGLQMFYVLWGGQLFKGISVLVWTAVQGFSFDQSMAVFDMMKSTLEWVLLGILFGALVAWLFGGKS